MGMMPAAMVMVVVQISFAGMNVLYKLAANDGMSLRIITAYRFLFAVPLMLPLALLVERNRPKLTWTILYQAFLCGLFGGSLSQNLYIESLALTSATFVAAMSNLIPVTTFILAVSLGMEKLSFGTMAGKAKVFGTLTGIGGAMLFTFYKGVQVNIWRTHINLLNHHGAPSSHPSSSNTLLGTLLAVAFCISYAVWLIIQAKMSKKYPCPYSSTALMCIMGAIQSIVYALCTEKDWNQWKLGWNIRLLTVVYAGIVVSGLTITMINWCVRIKGPLYGSIFNPLMFILVALAESLFLGEKLHLGSILGAVLIVLGLYVVLWGKGKEMEDQSAASGREVPLPVPPSTTSSQQDEPIEIIVNSTNDNTTSNNNHQNNVASS
ncbi:WAT1-related protein At1g68170-like isoform X1 [Durio zibethinus]|uniref:WAT1-related protein n=1 Tax=Durio zibethinus TaxID=66656 RepID=A0A6P5XAG4_DURZI|nr:WAT1-related protein At1g68170-like isoform X1 [Durio zibethinus]